MNSCCSGSKKWSTQKNAIGQWIIHHLEIEHIDHFIGRLPIKIGNRDGANCFSGILDNPK